MTAQKRRFLFRLIATVIFMGFIFYKSSQTYQQQDLRPALASWIPRPVLEKFLPHVRFVYDGDLITWEKPYETMEFFIRKAGHLSEYAVLALLWTFTCRSFPVDRAKAVRLAAVLTVVYAITDEWHQSFVPGRTGHAIDVAVDAAGAAAALLVYLGFSRWGNRSGNRR